MVNYTSYKRKRHALFVLFILMGCTSGLIAQISIVNTILTDQYITPALALNCIVMNGSPEGIGQIKATLTDEDTGEPLLTVLSNELQFTQGLNNLIGSKVSIKETQYASSEAGRYLRSQMKLPSGRYQYCIEVELLSGEPSRDRICDQFLSEYNDYLSLVFPLNRDTIFTLYPVLSWTSFFPLEAMVGKRKFRLLVAPMEEDDNPEAAISSNPALMVFENMEQFNVLYPNDASPLIPGRTYAWQVQSYMYDQDLDATEVWSFIVWKEKEKEPLKYAEVKRETGAEHYLMIDDKLYIAFEERYGGVASITSCNILDATNTVVEKVVIHDGEVAGEGRPAEQVEIRTTGVNKFLLDASDMDLPIGMYTLEIENYKGEQFKLRFQVQ